MRFALPLTSLSALALLAGCLNTPARPTGVDVSLGGIEVAMSNRQTCVATAPTPGTSWSGVLQGCDSPYPYRVVLDQGRNPLRDGIADALAAAGIALAPIATVEIEGPSGNTWAFTSPPAQRFDD